jgi:hypothetical protein
MTAPDPERLTAVSQMPETQRTLRTVYRAFNTRDIETALKLMHPDVDWPNAWEGGPLSDGGGPDRTDGCAGVAARAVGARGSPVDDRMRHSSRQELTDVCGERRGLVLGDQGVTVGDLHEPSLRQQLRQPPAVLGGHETVFAGPCNQRRAIV